MELFDFVTDFLDRLFDSDVAPDVDVSDFEGMESGEGVFESEPFDNHHSQIDSPPRFSGDVKPIDASSFPDLTPSLANQVSEVQKMAAESGNDALAQLAATFNGDPAQALNILRQAEQARLPVNVNLEEIVARLKPRFGGN